MEKTKKEKTKKEKEQKLLLVLSFIQKNYITFISSIFILGSILFGVYIVWKKKELRKVRELMDLETAYVSISQYDIGNKEEAQKALEKLESINSKEVKRISDFYKAYILSKEGNIDKAIETLENLKKEVKNNNYLRIIDIALINLYSQKDCEKAYEIWKKMPEGEIEIPLRTYFELANCTKNPDELTSIISSLDLIYTLHQLRDPEMARYTFAIRRFAENKLIELTEKQNNPVEGENKK